VGGIHRTAALTFPDTHPVLVLTSVGEIESKRGADVNDMGELDQVAGTWLALPETRWSMPLIRGRRMRNDTQFHLPLRLLALCLDCDECFEIGNGCCPACGSSTWAPLSRFLERRSSPVQISRSAVRPLQAAGLKRTA